MPSDIKGGVTADSGNQLALEYNIRISTYWKVYLRVLTLMHSDVSMACFYQGFFLAAL